MYDEIYRSLVKTLRSQPGFDELSEKTRIDLLLDKASRYEEQLEYVRSVMSGERPQQRLTLVDEIDDEEGPQTFEVPETFDCRESIYGNGRVHDAGARRNCPSCAVYMTELIADKLSLPDTTSYM